MLTRTFDLDMVPGKIPLAIHLSQYDSDVTLVFQLYTSQGILSIPSSGVTATIRGTKGDGNGISADAAFNFVDSIPTVTVQVTKQMTAIAGKNTFELVLKATSGNSEYDLPSANFILYVERAALDYDTLESKSEIMEIQEILADADNIIEALRVSETTQANMAALTQRAETAATSAEADASTASTAATTATTASNTAVSAVNVFDILDNMRGLDQNGDNVATAQVYGTIHVPNVTGAVIAHAKERYPDITITYDHVSAVLTYVDNDGTELATETIVDGAAPVNTPNLTNKEDNRYYYTFLGWARSQAEAQAGTVDNTIFNNITADTTAYAVYSLVEKVYTVRLYNGSTLVQTYENVAYGTTITPDFTPTYSGVGKAEDYTFTGWSPSLANITADIDSYAQFEFNGLYFRLLMDGTLFAYEDTQGVITSLAPYAFAGESYLETVVMPAATIIPEGCFRACPALENVSFPAAIATNAYAFAGSTVMEVLELPEVTLLNAYPLVNGMTALRELRLPKNTSGFTGMISSCNNIELLDVGVTTAIGTSLSAYAFYHLTYLIMRNTSQVTTPYSSTVFYSSSPLGKGEGLILVPRNMVDSYKEHSSWSRYADYIVAIEDYPSIAG